VREKTEAKWLIFQTSPLSKSFLLKGLLAKRFPRFHFQYSKFCKEEFTPKSFRASESCGIIAELKNFTKTQMRLLDRFWSLVKDQAVILVVTPECFKLLRKARPSIVQNATIVLSEFKSLDYVVQLPRLIEEVGKKNRLKNQNERLARMMEKTMERRNEASTPALGDIFEASTQKDLCGLHISLKKWEILKRKIGIIGHQEVLESIGRMINSAVRNSDRILRWKEDEFLIFLSNAEPRHLNMCRDRVERMLSSINLQANNKEVSIPFAVKPLEQMAFLN